MFYSGENETMTTREEQWRRRLLKYIYDADAPNHGTNVADS